jgi:hypothetical protein
MDQALRFVESLTEVRGNYRSSVNEVVAAMDSIRNKVRERIMRVFFLCLIRTPAGCAPPLRFGAEVRFGPIEVLYQALSGVKFTRPRG